jgi:glutaredoxin 3
MPPIKVYTRRRCPHCVSAKTWLRQRDYEFEEILLEDKDTVSEFLGQYPELRSVPQIFVGEEHIGGFTDLIKSSLAK